MRPFVVAAQPTNAFAPRQQAVVTSDRTARVFSDTMALPPRDDAEAVALEELVNAV
jgi:hypothetical protein